MSFKIFGMEFGQEDGYFHEEDLDFHRQKTQRVHSKPRLSEIEKGYLCCNHCGTYIGLGSVTPLNLYKCPKCSSILFIPMKVKDYWLYEPLGGGGMGSVYHAFHAKSPKLECAVKILPRNKKEDNYLIETLLREAEIGSRFGDHPHLTKVYEYGCADGEYFAVYEYVDGIRLDQIIESPVRRRDKEVLLWVLQVLSAEQHMFGCGYLFRDLKPQNVIINSDGNAKLIDYGLAMTVEDARENISDHISGSPYYIPPERVIGAPEGQYSEIYSLGMLLYHMMSGQTYYSADDVKSLLGKHVTTPRIGNIAVKLPAHANPRIASALDKMIHKIPQSRYQTYKEAGAALYDIYKACA